MGLRGAVRPAVGAMSADGVSARAGQTDPVASSGWLVKPLEAPWLQGDARDCVSSLWAMSRRTV